MVHSEDNPDFLNDFLDYSATILNKSSNSIKEYNYDLGMFLRFICHFISGIIFFGSYAPAGMSPIVYSIAVNGFAVGGELLICLALLAFLPIEQLIKALKSSVSLT